MSFIAFSWGSSATASDPFGPVVVKKFLSDSLEDRWYYGPGNHYVFGDRRIQSNDVLELADASGHRFFARAFITTTRKSGGHGEGSYDEEALFLVLPSGVRAVSELDPDFAVVRWVGGAEVVLCEFLLKSN